MSKLVVTGSLGLIGQACSIRFLEAGWEVIGIDNDYRKEFFGEDASVSDQITCFDKYDNYTHYWQDIRSIDQSLFSNVDLVIHCAAQPSHDWSYNNPQLDFSIKSMEGIWE